LFGPVDISETEPEPLSADSLAEILREGIALGDELDLFEPEIRERIQNLASSLENLPADLPPLPTREETFEEEPPWAFNVDELADEIHPVIDLIMAEMDWLGDLWPMLIALIDVRMLHPGDFDSDVDDDPVGGFGRHGDLVP